MRPSGQPGLTVVYMKSIAIFCGANPGTEPYFAQAAAKMGQQLAQRGIHVLFGGGSVGLMGVLADAVLAHGGRITGVITEQLNALELGHPGIRDMIVVESMSERRTLLIKGTDGVIALPGGYGTLDELFESLTLAQLHQYRKPIGLLNVQGYYDPLLHLFDRMVEMGFLKKQNRALCTVAAEASELLAQMEQYEFAATPKWL